mmetsp:Transcript_43761/g.103398  ORF Transcript_43761/g.103398 Transcript_43761/m.103398 type:complete len:481 (-) Transcript_43761:180-1622(-)
MMLMRGNEASTNNELVDMLQSTGQLRNAACCAAFRAVDRSKFWVESAGSIAFADMPLRHGRLHISAPHIYAKALESMLPLENGMSFLNIGSGTGYFSSIVAELLGKTAIHDGVDIWPETVAHAKQRCSQNGNHHINFTVGNVYNLDVDQGMRYDRIYLGACANARSKYLYRLLEVGGILIGPFQAGRSQELRKVVRCSETHFTYEVLSSVQFASLVEPPTSPLSLSGLMMREASPPSIVEEDGVATEGARLTGTPGLPGVPFTFVLREPSWTPSQSWLYPSSFRDTISCVLMGRPEQQEALYLPPEIWVKHIFPMCSRRWFEKQKQEHHIVSQARVLSALKKTMSALNLVQSLKVVSRVWSTVSSPHQQPLENPPQATRRSRLLFEALGDGPDHLVGPGSPDDPDDVFEDSPGLLASLLEAEARANRGEPRGARLSWPRFGSCLSMRSTSRRCQRVASQCAAFSRSLVRCFSAFILLGAR